MAVQVLGYPDPDYGSTGFNPKEKSNLPQPCGISFGLANIKDAGYVPIADPYPDEVRYYRMRVLDLGVTPHTPVFWTTTDPAGPPPFDPPSGGSYSEKIIVMTWVQMPPERVVPV